MGVMMLAAGQGSRVVVETEGPNETDALDAIAALIGSGFRENKKARRARAFLLHRS